MDMVKSQAEQVRAVEKSMKRLTAKVDMIDAKSDEILLAMSVVLEQLQLQQQPVRDYHGTELEASQRLDQAAQRLARYQSYPGTSSVSRGASRNSSFAREPKRTLSKHSSIRDNASCDYCFATAMLTGGRQQSSSFSS